MNYYLKKCNDIELIQKLPIKPETQFIELFASYSVIDPHYGVPPRYINMQMNIEQAPLFVGHLALQGSHIKRKKGMIFVFK